MRKVREAVRYGIETLGVSPDKLFSLIESSRDYEGQDYSRWLAGQIIKVAEARDIGFSQLLVKKFDIIRDLIEEVEDESSMREECVEYIKSRIGKDKSIFSYNMDEVGEEIDVDWFSKVDYGLGITDFYDSLPEDVRETIEAEGCFTLCAKLTSSKANNKSDLYQDAKSRGISCKSEGALILYRLCLLSDALTNMGISMNVTLTSDAKFLYNKDNEDIIKYFLECFNCEGIVIDSKDYLVNAFVGGRKAIIFCTTRYVHDGFIPEIQDGFLLDTGSLTTSGFTRSTTKRFSASSNKMLDYLKKTYPNGTDQVPVEKEGEVTSLGNGFQGALGYLCVSRLEDAVELSTVPITGMTNIPILQENLKQVCAYYGVRKSLEEFGMAQSIPILIDGHDKFDELVSNCIPLFLFDVDSKFKSRGVLRINGEIVKSVNPFDILTSNSVKVLIEKAEVFFSFEAKELYDVCSGFLQHLKEKASGKSFLELRTENYDDDLNSLYLSSLLHLKDYVNSLYRNL